MPAIPITIASIIAAVSPFDLMLDGYLVLWIGDASITRCLSAEDTYDLGPYTFTCDVGANPYPYRRGTVYLLVRDDDRDPGDTQEGFLCVRRDCFLGTIERSHPSADAFPEARSPDGAAARLIG